MLKLPDIEPFRQRFNEIEVQLANPEVFKDSRKASVLNRDHTRLRRIIDLYNESVRAHSEFVSTMELTTDEELGETANAELPGLKKRWDELKDSLLLAMLPEDAEEGKNTIVEIRAGAGGDEASLFAADLFRMYCKYGESKEWGFDCLSQSSSESGGFKEVVFLLKGEDVWSNMRFESGVHRVQRVPVTEAGGRIHTSTATVAVLPEAKEIEITIDPQDLEISVCRASGPGGQGVNTTDSAVQILHKPSGLSVYCADERSQLKNKSKAMTVLRSRLLKAKQAEENKKYANNRKNQVGTGDRSERIRTYNFPQSRITDHRINYTSHALNDTMMGDLEHLIQALIKHDRALKLASFNSNENL